MRRSLPAVLLLAVVSTSGLASADTMRTDVTSLVRESQLIFMGTIEKLGAATEANLPADRSTAIVQVEQVLRAPELLQAWRGQKVTVQLLRDLPAHSGEAAVFFTRSWVYGDSLGVVEIGRLDARQVDALSRQIREAEAQLADEKLSARIGRAHVTVLGTG